MKNEPHPRRLGRIRSAIERTSLHRMILYFALFLVLVALLVSCVIYVFFNASVPFGFLFAASFKLLIGSSEAFNELATTQVATRSDYLLITVVSFFGSIISFFATPLVFGAITAKLLISDRRFVIRKNLSIYGSKSADDDVLSIRLYNATETALVNCSYQVIARIRRKIYLEHEIVQSKSLEVKGAGKFSLMLPYIPFVVNLSVKKSDFDNNSRLVKLQGYELSDIDKLVLLIRGTIPGLLRDHTEYHLVDVSEQNIQYDRFADIDVDYRGYINASGRLERNFSYNKAREWKGWKNFEMTRKEIWVFGFGSIVDVESLERTLGRKVRDDDYQFTSLKNYRREWNVAMYNNHDIPEYKQYFYRDDGGVVDGYIAFLGLSECENGRVNGIIFKVEEDELAALDRREKNYRRVEISDAIDRPVPGSVVYCYMPSKDGIDRCAEGKKLGKLFISSDYKKIVEGAFKKAGAEEYKKYFDSTVVTTIPCIDVIKRRT